MSVLKNGSIIGLILLSLLCSVQAYEDILLEEPIKDIVYDMDNSLDLPYNKVDDYVFETVPIEKVDGYLDVKDGLMTIIPTEPIIIIGEVKEQLKWGHKEKGQIYQHCQDGCVRILEDYVCNNKFGWYSTDTHDVQYYQDCVYYERQEVTTYKTETYLDEETKKLTEVVIPTTTDMRTISVIGQSAYISHQAEYDPTITGAGVLSNYRPTATISVAADLAANSTYANWTSTIDVTDTDSADTVYNYTWYDNTAQSKVLSAYYPLNAQTVFDVTGRNANGTATNFVTYPGTVTGATLATGKYGVGYSFDGSNDKITISVPASNYITLWQKNATSSTWEFKYFGQQKVSNSTYIGLYGSTYFNGSIDEVRIYNRNLTIAQQNKIRDSPSPPCDIPGLVASYSFEGEAKDTNYICQKDHDEKAYMFRKELNSGYVSIPETIKTFDQSTFTLNLWLYPWKAASNDYDRIINNGNLNEVAIDRSNNIRLLLSGMGSWWTTTTNIPNNVWTMFTLKYNGTTLTTYKNGAFSDNATYTLTISNNTVIIGWKNTEGFNGSISGFLYYNYTLSADQIYELWNASVENRTARLMSDETTAGETWQSKWRGFDTYQHSVSIAEKSFKIYNCTDWYNILTWNSTTYTCGYNETVDYLQIAYCPIDGSNLNITKQYQCWGLYLKTIYEELNMIPIIMIYFLMIAVGYWMTQTGNHYVGLTFLLASSLVSMYLWRYYDNLEYTELGVLFGLMTFVGVIAWLFLGVKRVRTKSEI